MASAGGIKAGKAYVEVGADQNPFSKGLKAAGAKLRAWGTGIAALGASITAPLLALGAVFASHGRELLEMSEGLGLSVEGLSALQYAARKTGASSEDLAGGLSKMNRLIAEASEGGKGATDKLTSLGVSFAELAPLDTIGRLELLADRIAGIEDPGIRAGKALEIFGKGARLLIPLLRQGAAGIAEFIRQAGDKGLIISREDAESAKQFTTEMGALSGALKTAVMIIGGGLLPGLRAAFAGDKDLAAAIVKVARATGNWLRQNAGLIELLFKAGLYATAFGGALFVLGRVLPAVASGLRLASVAAGLFNAAMWLTNPIVFAVVAGILLGVGAAVLLLDAVGGLDGAMVGLGDAWRTVSRDFMGAWGGIQDTLAAGDLAGAMEIAGALLKLEWVRLTAWLSDAWAVCWHEIWSASLTAAGWILDIFLQIQGGFRIMGNIAQYAFEAAWAGIQNGAISVAEVILNAVESIKRGFQVAGNEMLRAARTAWAYTTNLTQAGYEAERDRINAETDAANATVNAGAAAAQAANTQAAAQLRAETNAGVMDLEAANAAVVAAIEAERRATEASVMQLQNESEADMLATVRANAAAVVEAQEELDDLLFEAWWNSPERGSGGGDDRQPGRGAAEAIAAHGTFSGAALAGFGTGGVGGGPGDAAAALARRSVDVQIGMAADIRRMLEMARNGGLIMG